MHNAASELPRIHLPRTSVNKARFSFAPLSIVDHPLGTYSGKRLLRTARLTSPDSLSYVSSHLLTLITMVASCFGMYHMSVLNPLISPPCPQTPSVPSKIPSPYLVGAIPSAGC